MTGITNGRTITLLNTDSGVSHDKTRETTDGYTYSFEEQNTQHPNNTQHPQNNASQNTAPSNVHVSTTENVTKYRKQSIKDQKKVTSVLEMARDLSEEKTELMEEGDREIDKMEKALNEKDNQIKGLIDDNAALRLQILELEDQLKTKEAIIEKIKNLTL